MTAEGVFLQKIEELEKKLAALSKENEKYKAIIDARNMKNAARDYKDRFFRFILGNPENKQWTLSLYNAINGTNYTNPDDLQINTIDDVVYMKMKNDVSFIIGFEMNIWEHQSTFNPNMPIRFLIYGGMLYEGYIATSDFNPYSSKLQPLPRPKCICFYNGTMEQPESQVLRLSDAFEGDGDIEVEVTMLNINYGKNQQLLDACAPLKDYSWLVDTVRRHQKDGMTLDTAVDTAIDELSDDSVIKSLLLKNRAEVKRMFLTEYNEEKVYEKIRKEEREDARNEVHEEVASDMLLEGGMPVSLIVKISRLSEDAVRALAKKLGVAVLG